MNYAAMIRDMLDEMRGEDIPDRFIKRIEFTVGGERYYVTPRDVGMFKATRTEAATNIEYHVNIAKIVAEVKRVRAEVLDWSRLTAKPDGSEGP